MSNSHSNKAIEFTATTWNLHKGRSILGFKTWKKMLSWLNNTQSDICFLQETLAKRQPHKRAHHFNRQIKQNIWHCQATDIATALHWNIALGPNVFKSTWRHGNAILSPHPLDSGGRWNISAHRFEHRGLLVAHLHLHHIPITLLCVHLSLTRQARIRQMHWLKQWIKKFAPKGPLILSGDFNDWKNDSLDIFSEIQLKEVAATLNKKGLTFPAFSPSLALDKMFVRDIIPVQWIEPDKQASWLSDHLPYIAKLKILV